MSVITIPVGLKIEDWKEEKGISKFNNNNNNE